MKKLFIALIVLLAALPAVFAVDIFNVTNSTTPPGNATANISLQILDFTTWYHSSTTGMGRNAIYPGYEYAFDGESVHFWAKISANTVYAAQNAVVVVKADGVTIATLTYVTGIGATYNPDTGKYETIFEGDYVVDVAALGGCANYELTVEASFNGVTVIDDLVPEAKYSEVNDLVALTPSCVTVNMVPWLGLFFNLPPNDWGYELNNPRMISLSSPLDRESWGVIGNLSIAVQDYTGTHSCLNGGTLNDTILASNIQMSLTGAWPGVYLQNNAVVDAASAFTVLAVNAVTGPGAFNEPVYFRMWFDGNHCDYEYTGGVVGLLYRIF